MRRMQVVTAVLLVAFLLTTATVALAGMGGERLLEPGTEAPEIAFTDINGVKSSIQTLDKGKALLLVFLQTTCRSCQREIEHLKGTTTKYPNLSVLAIFIDPTPREFKKFVTEGGYPYHFAWDEEALLLDAYGVTFAPTSFLLDKDRKIVQVFRGWQQRGAEELEEGLKSLAN